MKQVMRSQYVAQTVICTFYITSLVSVKIQTKGGTNILNMVNLIIETSADKSETEDILSNIV
jgi:hypothetical protein